MGCIYVYRDTESTTMEYYVRNNHLCTTEYLNNGKGRNIAIITKPVDETNQTNVKLKYSFNTS